MLVRVGNLVQNPGQQRTMLDPMLMEQLATQISERGMDPDHPVLVTPDEGEDYRIVRGHRRTMAYVIANWAKEDDNRSIHDLVTSLSITTHTEYPCSECGEVFDKEHDICPECGTEGSQYADEIQVISEEQLATQFGTLAQHAAMQGYEFHVMVEKYDNEAEEQVALISDSFGSEDPDVVGQAFAFSRAHKMGTSVVNLALNTGLSQRVVRQYLSLARAPKYIQTAVAEERLLLSHVRRIAKADKRIWRDALWQMADAQKEITHDLIASWIREMERWNPNKTNGFKNQTPLDKNVQRIEQLAYNKGKVNWPYWVEVVQGDYKSRLEAAGITFLPDALPELACENCKIRDALQELPRNRYYPCSMGESRHGCNQAVSPNDQFLIRSPVGRAAKTVTIRGQHFWTTLEDALAFYEERDKEPEPEPEEEESKLDAMTQLHFYMGTHHEYTGSSHPLAATCEGCSLHTENGCLMESDPWNVNFSVLVSKKGLDNGIPQCSKYMPMNGLHKLIPMKPNTHTQLGYHQIGRMIELVAGQIQMMGERVLPSLVGTPVEGQPEAFLKVYKRECNGLTDIQRLTLLKWVTARWYEIEQGEIPLELESGLELMFRREEYPRYDE